MNRWVRCLSYIITIFLECRSVGNPMPFAPIIWGRCVPPTPWGWFIFGFATIYHELTFPASQSFSGAGPSATVVPWILSGNGSRAERMMPLSPWFRGEPADDHLPIYRCVYTEHNMVWRHITLHGIALHDMTGHFMTYIHTCMHTCIRAYVYIYIYR